MAVAIGHLLTEGEGLGTGLEGLILFTLSTTVLYTGYELPDRSLSRAGAVDALRNTAVFVVAFVLLANAIVLIWHYEQGHVEDAQFVVIFAGVLGAAVGGQANVYAVEFREAFDRNQALTKLLTVNQRVLRHNLRNEVTIVLGHLEDGSDGAGASAEDVRIAREHLEHLLETSREAQQISDVWEQDATEEFDLPRFLAERVEAFETEYPDATPTIECTDPPLAVAHVALPLAVDELLENAAVHNGADVEITVSCREVAGGVAIEVADDGEGIPAVETDVLFNPAETTLEHGTGLGLWLVYWIAMQSDGELRFASNQPSGTIASIVMPTAT
ncbi:redox sensing protein [Salinarchaeum sp. Harcht-Bsk1]|nr:redox sensing protein [Salinarchaeum sp. Harcht-Bsk1]